MRPRLRPGRIFFDDARILRHMDRATAKALSRAGAIVMTRARSSIRKPRQIALADMTSDERKAHRIRLAIARRTGKPRPKRRLASSRPGEKPRDQTGVLKGSIEFAYDPATRATHIGPIVLSRTAGAATKALEHGGTKVEKRPFMMPALRDTLPKIAPLFAHTLR